MTAKEEIPVPEIHPLKQFRKKWDLTQLEAGEFFQLSSGRIRNIERDWATTPKWIKEWLQNPMMEEETLARRIKTAKAVARIGKRRRPDGNGLIPRWRKAKGFSQRQAATYFGVHWTTVSAWELGDRPIPEHIIEAIEKELNNELVQGK